MVEGGVGTYAGRQYVCLSSLHLTGGDLETTLWNHGTCGSGSCVGAATGRRQSEVNAFAIIDDLFSPIRNEKKPDIIAAHSVTTDAAFQNQTSVRLTTMAATERTCGRGLRSGYSIRTAAA